MTADGFAWQRLTDGGVAVRWPPAGAAVGELLAAQAAWVSGGVRYAQADLPTDADPSPLGAVGFRPLTVLEFLRRDLTGPLSAVPPTRGLDLRPADQVDPAVLRDTVTRTYLGSLDAPELNALRLDDGSPAAGVSLPLVAFRGPAPVGVLLLDAAAGDDAVELAYLGVVPEARRAGVAAALVGFTLAHAAVAGRRSVVLSLDERNAPARRLYTNLGFRLAARRAVWWWVNGGGV